MIRLIIVGLMAGTITIPVAIAGAYAIGGGIVGVAKRLSRALAFGNSAVSQRSAAQTPAAVPRGVSSPRVSVGSPHTQGDKDAMSNSSAVLIPRLCNEVLTSGLVKAAAAPTDEARQRAVRLCEEAAAVLGMPDSDIAACQRAAAAKVAA